MQRSHGERKCCSLVAPARSTEHRCLLREGPEHRQGAAEAQSGLDKQPRCLLVSSCLPHADPTASSWEGAASGSRPQRGGSQELGDRWDGVQMWGKVPGPPLGHTQYPQWSLCCALGRRGGSPSLSRGKKRWRSCRGPLDPAPWSPRLPSHAASSSSSTCGPAPGGGAGSTRSWQVTWAPGWDDELQMWASMHSRRNRHQGAEGGVTPCLHFGGSQGKGRELSCPGTHQGSMGLGSGTAACLACGGHWLQRGLVSPLLSCSGSPLLPAPGQPSQPGVSDHSRVTDWSRSMRAIMRLFSSPGGERGGRGFDSPRGKGPEGWPSSGRCFPNPNGRAARCMSLSEYSGAGLCSPGPSCWASHVPPG